VDRRLGAIDPRLPRGGFKTGGIGREERVVTVVM
jgi:hypothetical protein